MKGSFYVPASKSLVNRYLILKQGYSELDLAWESKALDVIHLQEALNGYRAKETLYIGEGGTTLRFLALFLSTKKGEWILKGKSSLFKRPQEELLHVLKQLGSEVSLGDDSLTLKSSGWRKNNINVAAKTTTQVLTGLILSSLSSKNKLTVNLTDRGVNSDYLKLTLDFVSSLGFDVKHRGDEIVVRGDQKPVLAEKDSFIESDWSTGAFLYVMGALFGEIELKGLRKKSVQPDAVILDVLKSSGAVVSDFSLKKAQSYKPFDVNLQKAPDLFPVLSVFACFCKGESKLFGAPQLIFKESNRISKMAELLKLCGYKVFPTKGGIEIKGEGFRVLEHEPFIFDVSTDHRIFMACEILKKYGYKIKMTGVESVKKSFPEYLDWSL